MEELIKLDSYPIRGLVGRLLQDKTTRKNILFASDSYADYGDKYKENLQMTEEVLLGFASCDIQPRAYKATAEQTERTRKRAEVFTPAWIVNQMNNHCDAEWFGRPDVFNHQSGQEWTVNTEPIEFPKGKNWKQYVDSRRLEITCGEAPYIVSRYDTATGEIIPLERRIGILDRKLRIVNENAADEDEWFKWAFRAFQSVYGYEYQGDNLLIARMNLLYTLADYIEAKWHRQATQKELEKFLNVICWNFWQMDGLKDTVPLGSPSEVYHQMSLFGEEEPEELHKDDCKIYDWRGQKSLLFRDRKEGMLSMKFDFVIGNPPYQEDNDNNNRQKPVYNLFMEEAFKVSDVVELITPARFLFDAGQTPKAWNKKMLNDKNFTVLLYEQNGASIFPNTEIKGGVAITLRNKNREYGEIGVFTAIPILNYIIKKVSIQMNNTLSECAFPKSQYGFSEEIYIENPELKQRLTKGNEYIIDANIFGKMPEIFSDKPSNEGSYILIFGRQNNQRIGKYIKSKYIKNGKGVDKYKVFVTGANGSGKFGETLSSPFIGKPQEVGTQTYMSFGFFDTAFEANSCLNYIKTKFARCMLGVLKVTQNNPRDVWRYIPLQDFTSDSDIDWSKSIPEIDQQLYKKYDLTPDEIKFIETHVKEMD